MAVEAGDLLVGVLDGAAWSELLARIDDAILAEVPALGSDEEIRTALHRSTEAALGAHRAALAGSLDPVPDVPAPVEARELGRSMARRGLGAEVVLRAFRTAQQVMWREVMDLTMGLGMTEAGRHDLLTLLWDYMSGALDRSVDEVMASHGAEMQRRWAGATARRQRVVGDLLAGVDLDLTDASTALGYRLRDHHLAAVLWWGSDPSSAEQLAERLELGVRRLAATLPGAAVLSVPHGEDEMRVWLGTPGRPDAGALGAAALPVGVRVAVGNPASGADGFRIAHEEAVRAQAVALVSEADTALTRYADVEMVALMWADPPAARRLVRRELAGLADPSPESRRLRETLALHRRLGSSAKAAAALGVHKNTVLYRLAQVEERLGRPPGDAGPELDVALRLAAVLGDLAW